MHTTHLLLGVAIQPNLELKTWPKQLLGSLPLDIALSGSIKQLTERQVSVNAKLNEGLYHFTIKHVRILVSLYVCTSK